MMNHILNVNKSKLGPIVKGMYRESKGGGGGGGGGVRDYRDSLVIAIIYI